MIKMIKHLRQFFTKPNLSQIPSLRQFMNPQLLRHSPTTSSKPTFHIQTYGCQMNINDSQIVRSFLTPYYEQVADPNHASIMILNTCAIRQSAQEKIYQRIKEASKESVIAILGCMAQRLKEKLFTAGVQVVCGPDSYRDLPRLLALAVQSNTQQMNVALSAYQTYADISPIRRNPHSVTAFLSIMRGCNNMCSFCIVPFVRGRERSRNLSTILQQIAKLQQEGVKEIIFLGQNVNSYHDLSTDIDSPHHNSQGFSELFKLRNYPGARFVDLLQSAASTYPNIRFRFTSPHPKDFPEQVLSIITKYNNICKQIHLPAQSGNSQVLTRMRRNHTRQAYLQLVEKMRKIKGLALSTDLIAGFCGETQEQFQDTLSLLKTVKFEMAFLFAYSMREKTHAHRNYPDDVPEKVKQRRVKQLIDTFVQIQAPLNQTEVGKLHLLLLEGKAKREQGVLMGKTDNYKNGYVKIQTVPVYSNGVVTAQREFKIGDYLIVQVQRTGARSLYCKPIGIASTLNQFYTHQRLFQQLCPQQQQVPNTV